jgi:hypothetical protein
LTLRIEIPRAVSVEHFAELYPIACRFLTATTPGWLVEVDLRINHGYPIHPSTSARITHPHQFCQTPRFRIRTASRTSAACASTLFLNTTLYFGTKSNRNRSPNFFTYLQLLYPVRC